MPKSITEGAFAMQKQKEKPYLPTEFPAERPDGFPIEFPEPDGIASGMETTGLMPTVPDSVEEYASYEDLAGLEFPSEYQPEDDLTEK